MALSRISAVFVSRKRELSNIKEPIETKKKPRPALGDDRGFLPTRDGLAGSIPKAMLAHRRGYKKPRHERPGAALEQGEENSAEPNQKGDSSPG